MRLKFEKAGQIAKATYSDSRGEMEFYRFGSLSQFYFKGKVHSRRTFRTRVKQLDKLNK